MYICLQDQTVVQQIQPGLDVSSSLEHEHVEQNNEVSLLSRSLSPPGELDRTFVLKTPNRVQLPEIELQCESVFMCQMTQVVKFLEDINSASCRRRNCKGSIKLVVMEQHGLGEQEKWASDAASVKVGTLIFTPLPMMSKVKVQSPKLCK